MGDSTATLAVVLTAKDLASRQLGHLHDSLGKVEGKSRGLNAGLGTLAKVGILGVVGAAVGLVGILGEATAAAVDEQKNIAKLNAALKASDKSFTGNTTKIDTAIAAREKLAFSDDALRDSLAFLVTKTHDSDKALQLQSTAMDLARLKGIDLTTASEMLTKGMDGNAKVLKQLGISLPATATAQERLTAIQGAAAGQAKAYGETAAGAQESMRIAIDDVTEDIGQAFLPVVKDVAFFVRDNLIPFLRQVANRVGDWMKANKPLIDGIAAFVGGALKTFVDLLGAVFTALGKVVGWITSNKAIMDAWKRFWSDVARNVQAFAAGLKWIIDNIGKVLKAMDQIYGNVQAGSPAAHYLGIPGSAAGGWVGLNGPEIRRVGERGPEYVIPNHQLGGGMGGSPVVVQLQVDGRTLARIVDERLFYSASRSAGTRYPT